MAFYRDIFTGELKERDGVGRQIIARIEPAYAPAKRCKAYDSGHPYITNTLSVDISQMEQFNADAKRHNTGAYYRPDPRNPLRAQLVCETRGARNRELARRQVVDMDGGYGDYTDSSRPAV